jgi:hypothetical protein
VLLVGSGVERVKTGLALVLLIPKTTLQRMLERFETPASNEDGKLNISGDRGDLLPPH